MSQKLYRIISYHAFAGASMSVFAWWWFPLSVVASCCHPLLPSNRTWHVFDPSSRLDRHRFMDSYPLDW